MAVVGELMIRAGIDIADVVTGAAGVAKEMEGLSNSVDRQLGSLDKLSARWQEVGTSLTTYVTLPLAALSAAMIKASVDFDDASDRIRARTGATGEALAGMGETFKNVFSSIPTSAHDASEAISELVQRLNISGKPLEELATQELNLARITETSVGPLVAETTRLFGDWGIEVGKESAALDYLYKTTQSTGIGITKLTSLVVQFGEPLRALGLNMEQSAALIGKWEKEGVNITTVLSGMRRELGNMAKAGIDTSAGYQAIIDAIKNTTNASDALSLSFKIFGQRAAVDMRGAIQAGKFDIDTLTESIKSNSDTINKAAEATLSFSDKLVLMRNKIETALEPIGTVLTGMFEHVMDGSGPILEFIHNLSEGFAKLSPTTQEWIVGLAAAAAAIGPLAIGAAALVTGFTAVTSALAPVVAGIAGFLVSMSGISAVAIEADASLGLVALGAGALATALIAVGVGFTVLNIVGLAGELSTLGHNLLDVSQAFLGTSEGVSKFEAASQETIKEVSLLDVAMRVLGEAYDGLKKKASQTDWKDLITPWGILKLNIHDVNEELAHYVNTPLKVQDIAPIKAVADQMHAQAEAQMKVDAANKALADSNDLAAKRARQFNVDLSALTAGHEKAAAATHFHDQSLRQWYISANKFLDTLVGPKNLTAEIEAFNDKMLEAFHPQEWLDKWQGRLDSAFRSMASGIPKQSPQIVSALKSMFEEVTQAVLPTIEHANSLLSSFGVMSQQDAAKSKAEIEKTRKEIEDIYLSSNNRIIGYALVNSAQMEEANITAGERQIALARKTGQAVTDAQIEALAAQKLAFTNAHMDIEEAYKNLSITSTKHYDEEYSIAKTAYDKIVAYKNHSTQDLIKADADLYSAALADQQAHGDRVTEIQKEQLAKIQELASQGQKTFVSQVDEMAVAGGKAMAKGMDNILSSFLAGKLTLKKAWDEMLTELTNAFVKAFISPVTKSIGDFIANSMSQLLGGKGFGGLTDAATKAGSAIKSALSAVTSGGVSTDDAGFVVSGATKLGAGAAKGATDAAGGVVSGSGGATSALGGLGSSLSGIANIANIANAGISALSGIVAGVQAAHANALLDKIEKSTREVSTVMWQTGSESVQGILKNLYTTTLQVVDRLVDLRTALFDPVAQDLEAILAKIGTGISVGTGITDAITDGTDGTTGAVETGTAGVGAAVQTASQTAGEHLLALEKQLEDLNVEIVQTKTVLSADNKALADQLKKNGDKNDPLYLALKAKVDADNALIQKDTATATAVTTAIKGQQAAIANAEKGIVDATQAAAGGIVSSVENSGSNLTGTITQTNGQIINALGQTGAEAIAAQHEDTEALLQQLGMLGSDLTAASTITGNAYSDLKATIKGVSAQSLADQKAAMDRMAAQAAAAANMGLTSFEREFGIGRDWIPGTTGGVDDPNRYKGPTEFTSLAPMANYTAPVTGPIVSPGMGRDFSNQYGYVAPDPRNSPVSGPSAEYSRTSKYPVQYATTGNVAPVVNFFGPVTDRDYAAKIAADAARQLVQAGL